MSNLLASLLSSAGTLEAYGRVLETAQNNVSNASTPGYAKQSISLHALAFDPAAAPPAACGRVNCRTRATNTPRPRCGRRPRRSGYQDQTVNSLTEIEARFDISGNSGIPLALNNMLQSFSAWATTPGNTAVRQTVVERASELADAFNQTYNALADKATTADRQISQTVDLINQKVAELQNYNHIALQGNKEDSGLNARMHAALDELSQYVDFNATFQSDGTVSIMANGQTPLLLDDKQYKLSANLSQLPNPTYPNAPASDRILGSDGRDITAETTGGHSGRCSTSAIRPWHPLSATAISPAT